MNIKRKVSLILISAILFSFGIYSFAYALDDGVFYNTVDISSSINGKVYLTEDNYKSVTIDSNDDFLSWGGDTYRHNVALSWESLEQQMTDGVFISKSGIPYKLYPEGAISIKGTNDATTYTNSVEVDIADGKYEKVSFLAFSVNGSSNFNAFTVKINYTDGTSDKHKAKLSAFAAYDEADATAAGYVKTYLHWGANLNKGTTITSFGLDNSSKKIDEFSFIPNSGKTVASVTFLNEGGSNYGNWYEPAKVLALSLGQKSISSLIIEVLPIPDDITLDNLNDTFDKIKSMEDSMLAQGITEEELTSEAKARLDSVREKCEQIKFEYIDSLVEALPGLDKVTPNTYYDILSQIENLEDEMEKYEVSEDELTEVSKTKLSELREKLKTVKPTYTMFDISSYRSSKLFVYEDAKENIRIDKKHDFFNYGQAGTYYNNYALSGDALKEAVGDDNIVEDKSHIPYLIDSDLTIPVSGSDYGISGVDKTEVDLPDGAYSSVNFLAFSLSGTAPYGSTTITLKYDDNSTTVFKKYEIKPQIGNDSENDDWVFGVPSYAHWKTGYLDTVSFDTASGNYGIYTYEVIPEAGKIVDSITFQNTNTYLGWYEKFKVLAISAVDETPEKIEAFTEKKLSELKSLATISSEDLKAIKANLNKLEELGRDTQSLNGIDEFEGLYENLFEVKSSSVTSESSQITVAVELSKGAVNFESDKIKLYSDDKEINSSYIDFSFSGENGETDKIIMKFPNFLDYDSEYKVVLSKDIRSAYDERLTLCKDREIKFQVEPTVYIYDLKAVSSGKEITLEAHLLNETDKNSTYAIMFGLYSKDGRLLDYLFDEGNLEAGEGKIFTDKKLTVPENETDYTVEFYAIDSSENRRLIWEPIVLIGG